MSPSAKQPNLTHFLPEHEQVLACENNKDLTLINPSLMTAHFSKIALKTEGISFRLTSLPPINPANQANQWETLALEGFKENVAKETTSFTPKNGTRVLNYIAPLYVKTHCLRCHVKQNYTIGDIAGGISLSTPLNENKTGLAFIISHISAAIFGTIILLSYGILLQRKQKQLMETKNKAEQANQDKSNFLASMSHELRTPLSGIIGMVGIMQKNILDKKTIQPLDDIESSAQSLITITNDILDFSKLEINKLSLAEESFQLDDVCQKCIRLISPLAESKELKIHYTFAPNIPKWLKGDPLRLRQIILNLLQNGVKFTPSGSIQLTVKLHQETIQKALIIFAITDTGIGLSQTEQENLFHPYQQANKETSLRYGGTGLGLYICKQLTGLMNGSIWIESTKHNGATFFFTADLLRSPPPKITAQDYKILHQNQQKKILLAEDSAINRKVLNKILSDYGYQCTSVQDGQEALNQATINHYDIILLDSRMPKLNGPKACREIRKTLYGATTPILALTADITEQEHGLCLDAGMDDVIIKPVDPTALLLTIDRLIAQYTHQNDK